MPRRVRCTRGNHYQVDKICVRCYHYGTKQSDVVSLLSSKGTLKWILCRTQEWFILSAIRAQQLA